MNTNMAGSTAKPIDYLQLLDDSDRRLFFFALDYATEYLTHNGSLPPKNIFDGLTSKKHVTDYVMAYAQTLDRETLRNNVAALQAWKPLFIVVPPGQATGHRISISGPVNKTDAPLSGATLLDGRSAEWTVRLKEKSDSYFSDTSSPLILNYYEARQIRAEYASRDFKSVSAERASTFPNSLEEQRRLVAKLYDSILNMDNILERKRPISLKKASGDDSSNYGDIDTNSPPINTSRKRTAAQRDEAANDMKKTVEGDDTLIKKGDTPPPKPAPQQKETISVTKVKGLSRIEVEMLSWEILYTIRDVDRGQVPFMHWSGRDWGWDSQFTSFLDRFEAVATTLRRSKAAVCSLLESDYMARLAAHPRREYRRKENNRSQNAERNAQVFVGRHAIGTGQVQVGQTGDLQDRDGNVVAAAGTVHSGLIEQTRKLGEMSSRRESAAKRAKSSDNSPTTSSERSTAGDAESGASGKEPPPKTSQKKNPRVRNRKIAVKAEAAAGPKAKVSPDATVAESMSSKHCQNTSGNPAAGAAGQTTFVPTSTAPAPFSWSGDSNGTAPAGTAHTTPFVDQIPWSSTTTYGFLPQAESFTGLSQSNTSFDTSNFNFPSVVTDFSLLNSDANLNQQLRVTSGNTFTLPFRPAPSVNTETQSGNASTDDSNSASAPDSPIIVTEAPMEDVFRMNIAINTGASGGGEGDATAGSNNTFANSQPIVVPQQQMVQATIDPSQWTNSVEEMNLYYQMALLNNHNQSFSPINYTGEVDTTSPSSGTNLDMSMFTIPGDLMWAINNNSDPIEFGEGSSPGQTDNGET